MGINSNQKVYIDLIAYPVEVLGPNTRVGVWFQGCNIGCIDCIATFTWNNTDDKLTDTYSVSSQLLSFNSKKLTISGGEPFNQPDALYQLLQNIRQDFDDILIYSGYEYVYLEKEYPYILNLVDVLIDGPFKRDMPTAKKYKGSQNQKMYIFTNSLIDEYQEYIRKTDIDLQIYHVDNMTYILGIPNISDRKKIQNFLNGELNNDKQSI